VSAGTNAVLDRLGLAGAIAATRPARLAAWRLTASDSNTLELPLASADGALALPRRTLDAALLAEAVRAGARSETGVRVSDVTPDRRAPTITCRGADGRTTTIAACLVVGADGLRSIVARRIGAYSRRPRLRKFSLTAHLTRQGPGGRHIGELFFGGDLCVGVAPVDEAARIFNVTVVAAHPHARTIASDAHGFFARALDRFPALRGRFELSHDVQLLGSGPFDWPTRRITADGVALVGDAAGYYDPLTGQGIHQAIVGAVTLAAHADAALRRGDELRAPHLRGYAREQRRLVRPARRLQRLLEFMTSDAGRADFAITRLRAAHRAARALLDATNDLAPPTVLLYPKTLLSFAAPGRWRSR
jgi:2-polyprenyl-6-methoxyphenol hydroxylase-like FAD-dependent oxidoreductase